MDGGGRGVEGGLGIRKLLVDCGRETLGSGSSGKEAERARDRRGIGGCLCLCLLLACFPGFGPLGCVQFSSVPFQFLLRPCSWGGDDGGCDVPGGKGGEVMDGRGGGGVCLCLLCMCVCLSGGGEEKHPGGKGSGRERGKGGGRKPGRICFSLIWHRLKELIQPSCTYRTVRYFLKAKKPETDSPRGSRGGGTGTESGTTVLVLPSFCSSFSSLPVMSVCVCTYTTASRYSVKILRT
ncbi:hypothetical protein BDP55DRAFT_374602 [Colletotrichum godetiae]|uniref:Uncharacterized protein n=1 Tax=Colletotrichum godetiae TaxID=1209918 RepID=A0AAJ0ENN1_9PEZI|nr:uncharacterized protein BDP55DRAFT_374602 [Colletotrichum godetiae]KAK1658771.1 hypothetical protein BDP55DRAFT_374602 [Colletotrichum godetiae]